jgi:hypothetical protein
MLSASLCEATVFSCPSESVPLSSDQPMQWLVAFGLRLGLRSPAEQIGTAAPSER